MCGIAGIAGKDAKRYEPSLAKMVSSLVHRGPDSGGLDYFKNCALGHRRLDIIDLLTGGQPMYSPDRKIAIIFNGEIYGYKAIRNLLKGYPFHSTSDTEVVIALYKKYQLEFLEHLPGMFAFAIWDDEKQTLICARDRFGEKPLYFALGPAGELIFASEIKAILASNLIKPIIDPKALRHYLKHLYVPASGCIYKNIFNLPPAHVLIFKKGKIVIKKYWSPSVKTEKMTLTEASEKFSHLFSQAVEKVLIADVPVGALLSGGLDSTSVVAIAARFSAKIKTFSFGFEGSRSELPFAREVAKRFGTNHHEFLEKDVKVGELMVKMASVYDEPFADSSNIPQYLISQLTKKYVKVALCGDGGDELLGGYSSWYRPLYFMDRPEKFFWPRLLFLQILSSLYSLSSHPFPLNEQFHLEGLKYKLSRSTIGSVHEKQLSFFTDRELNSLGLLDPRTQKMAETDSLNQIFKKDIENYLPGDILVKTDRASMAWGLELRAPFLEVDLAQFCLSVPSNLKIDEREDKILLRHAFKDLLPEKIRLRRKQGFGAPVGGWLQRSDVQRLKQQYLGDSQQKIYSIFPYPNVQELTDKNDYRTWSLLNLSIWLSKHSYDL